MKTLCIGVLLLSLPRFASGGEIVSFGNLALPAPEGYDYASGAIAVWESPTHEFERLATAITSGGELITWGEWGSGNSGLGYLTTSITVWRSANLCLDGSLSAGPPPPESPPYIAASAGGCHSLAIRQDGSIVAWGRNDQGQLDVPEPNEGWTAVAAGGYSGLTNLGWSVGIRGDSLVAWGYPTYTQVPQPNSGFVSVVANETHTLALRRDGSIAAFGDGWAHQCEVPEPNEGFTAIAAGGLHLPYSLGVRDGEIIGWGIHPPLPVDNWGFTAVAAGERWAFGVRDPTATVELELVAPPTLVATPNPFSMSTRIAGGRGELRIYDVAGRLVRELPGADWDGKDERGRLVPAGAYLVRDQARSVAHLMRIR